MYDVTLSRVRATIVAVEKRWLLHSLSVCICSLKISSMQCACAMLSSVACPALHFFTLSHKRHEYRKKVTEHKMCVLILSTNFVWNISHSKKKWARYDKKNIYIDLHAKYPSFFSDFNEAWIFSQIFGKKILKYGISWKSVPLEPSCLMRTDGQTNRHDEANSRFSQFCYYA